MSNYRFPSESSKHEGTWLIWPHWEHTDDPESEEAEVEVENLEAIWVKIVKELHTGEKVHVVAYDEDDELDSHEDHIKAVLEKKGKMTKSDIDGIKFVTAKTDSYWVRDTGPMFVFDEDNKLTIADFAFDSWGKVDDNGKKPEDKKYDEKKVRYEHDNELSNIISEKERRPLISESDLNILDFVLEGGAFETDGEGTLIACKSSVISKNRNLGWTKQKAIAYFKKYLGVTNIIWLEGELCDEKNKDVTDCHIDGLVRFFDSKTVISLPEKYFPRGDFKRLKNAKNAKGEQYKIIELPVETDEEWYYINYYIGNNVILLPSCKGPSEGEVIELLFKLYGKEVVPIDVTHLIEHDGAIHCITQQQPSET
jgi:agmatine deiminase